jgi:hypothetical protein
MIFSDTHVAVTLYEKSFVPDLLAHGLAPDGSQYFLWPRVTFRDNDLAIAVMSEDRETFHVLSPRG